MSYLDKYTLLETYHRNNLQHIQTGYLTQDTSQVVFINCLFKKSKLPIQNFEYALPQFTSYLDFEETEEALVFITLYNEGYAIEKYFESYPLTLEVRLSIAHQLFDLMRRYISLPLFIQDKLIDTSHLIVAKEQLFHNELLVFSEDYALPLHFNDISIRLGKLLSFIVPDVSDRHAQSFYTIIDDLLQGNAFSDLSAVFNTYDLIAAKHRQIIAAKHHTGTTQTDVWTAFQELSSDVLPITQAVTAPIDSIVSDPLITEENPKQDLPLKKEKDLPDDFPFKDIIIPSFIKNIESKINHDTTDPYIPMPVETELTEKANDDMLVEDLVVADSTDNTTIPVSRDDLESVDEIDSDEGADTTPDTLTDTHADEMDPIESIHLQIDDRLEIESRRKKRLWLILIPTLLVLSTLLGYVLLNPSQLKAYEPPIAQFSQSKIGDVWHFQNLSTSDPMLTLTAYYWTVAQGGSTLYTTTDKDLTYDFKTVGTYIITLKAMDSKSKWSAPFTMSLAIDDVSLQADITPPIDTTVAPSGDKTTSPISPGIERDPSEARSGEGSYLITLKETSDPMPELVLDPYSFEGKGVVALWMKAPQSSPIEMTFIGKNENNTLFTDSLSLKDYPVNQWFLVTKTIETQLIDTFVINFKGSNFSFWVDDISIETIK